jgi:hypothetical protein
VRIGQGLGQRHPERLVDPADVTPEVDQPVLLTHDRAHRGRATDADRAGRHALLDVAHELGQRRHHLVGRAVAPGPGDLPAVEHHAAETDPGRGNPVDLDGERVHVEAFRFRTHHEGGPTGPAVVARDLLADQADRRQVGGECADRAAVEPQARGELGPRRGSLDVDIAQQRAEVVAPDLLLARACPHALSLALVRRRRG